MLILQVSVAWRVNLESQIQYTGIFSENRFYTERPVTLVEILVSKSTFECSLILTLSGGP